MTGAEIIEGHPAPRPAEGVDKACRLFEIGQSRGFSDLHDQPTGDIGPMAQERNQRLQSWPDTRRQPGYIEPESHLGMPRQLPNGQFEDIVVDKSD